MALISTYPQFRIEVFLREYVGVSDPIEECRYEADRDIHVITVRTASGPHTFKRFHVPEMIVRSWETQRYEPRVTPDFVSVDWASLPPSCPNRETVEFIFYYEGRSV